MNNEHEIHKVVPILQAFVALIKQKLEDISELSNLGYQINVEAWANDNGVATGAVSCSKSAPDDGVELTVDVQYRQEYIEVWLGIYWSTGRVIKDIAEQKIFEKDDHEICRKVTKFLETYNQISRDYLLDFLIR